MECAKKQLRLEAWTLSLYRLMTDTVSAGEPGRDAGEPEGHQGQTQSVVLSGEGDCSCTERVHGFHQKQPQQCHAADPPLPTDYWCGGTHTNSKLTIQTPPYVLILYTEESDVLYLRLSVLYSQSRILCVVCCIYKVSQKKTKCSAINRLIHFLKIYTVTLPAKPDSEMNVIAYKIIPQPESLGWIEKWGPYTEPKKLPFDQVTKKHTA